MEGGLKGWRYHVSEDMFGDSIRLVMGEEWFLLVAFSGDGLTFDCGFEWRVRGTGNSMITFLVGCELVGCSVDRALVLRMQQGRMLTDESGGNTNVK